MNMSELIIRCNGLSKMCRLCLAADQTIFIDIYSFCNEINLKMSDLIMKCAPVQIDIKDKLPSIICVPCHQKLILICKFQKKILSSEKMLILYLEKLNNFNSDNIDFLKPALNIKKEPLDVTVKYEDDSNDSSEQLKYKDIGDPKFHLNDPMSVEDVKAPIATNFVAFDFEKDCQPSDNSDFCTADTSEQGDTDIKGLIIEYSGEHSIDIGETKVCVQNTLDDGLKKPNLTDFRQNVSIRDELNEFCLPDVKINNNTEAPDQYNNYRNIPSKKWKVKRNADIKNRHQCNVCDKSFSCLSALIVHKRIHTGEKPYKCNLCDKCFSQAGSLIGHRRIHTDKKPYKCDICDKSFCKSSDLVRHKRTHTGEKPYKCDFCDKTYSRLDHLIGHKHSHTGKKLYKCEFCDKSFFWSNNLTEHKRIHTGDKPYKCKFCEKSFAQSRSLSDHKRTHTGERPYNCGYCYKRFSQRKDLTRHKRTHTGKKI